MAALSIKNHTTDADLNFRLTSDRVKSYETNLILGLLAGQGLCKRSRHSSKFSHIFYYT